MPYMLKYPPGYNFELHSDPVWIGNDPTDEIQINDLQTQSHMAVIELVEQGYHVTNRGTFSFYVNGFEIPPGASFSLEDGYEIRIGQSVISYFWINDEPAYEYTAESSRGCGWLIIPILIVVIIVLFFVFSGYHFK